MGFNRPSDIAFIVGIGLLVILTVSLGVISVQTNQNVTSTDPVFTTANTALSSFQNASVTSSSALTTDPGQTGDLTDTNIYVASFNAILSLGEMLTTAGNLISQFADSLHIPTYFLTIIIGLLLVLFAVVTYSWFRGSSV
jgi:hypothetical protein